MRSKEEFKKRFRFTVAGMAAYGIASEVKDGPLKRAETMYDMPGNVELLLDTIYEYLAEKDAPKK